MLKAALVVICLALVVTAWGSASTDRLAGNKPVWPKVSHLPDGSTVSVSRGGVVIERDRRGRPGAESSFGSYPSYARWVKFMASFQTAAKTGDRNSIARQVAYPLTWNHGDPNQSTVIANPQELMARYHDVFTPALVAAIVAPDPRALFCKNISQVMLGSGVIWGDARVGGGIAIVSINGTVL